MSLISYPAHPSLRHEVHVRRQPPQIMVTRGAHGGSTADMTNKTSRLAAALALGLHSSPSRGQLRYWPRNARVGAASAAVSRSSEPGRQGGRQPHRRQHPLRREPPDEHGMPERRETMTSRSSRRAAARGSTVAQMIKESDTRRALWTWPEDPDDAICCADQQLPIAVAIDVRGTDGPHTGAERQPP
jgi:hypothetical protein